MTIDVETVARWARESGLFTGTRDTADGKYIERTIQAQCGWNLLPFMVRFAGKARADLLDSAELKDAMREAIEREREACAQVCNEMARVFAFEAQHDDLHEAERKTREDADAASMACAHAIRARSAA